MRDRLKINLERNGEIMVFGSWVSFDDVCWDADDGGKVRDVSNDDRASTDDGGLADSDPLNDGGPDADEGKRFYGDMPGDADTRTDVSGIVDDGFVIDDASGIENGGVFNFDESANVGSGGDDDVFSDLGGVGDIRTGVYSGDEANPGVVKRFGIGIAYAIITDGDDRTSDSQFCELRDEGEVTQDFKPIHGFLVQSGVGIKKSRDFELMGVS